MASWRVGHDLATKQQQIGYFPVRNWGQFTPPVGPFPIDTEGETQNGPALDSGFQEDHHTPNFMCQ